MDFTAIKCSVCGKFFEKGDDIVVCPECGAPYHRKCYQEVGKCIYSDFHGTDKSYSPPQKEKILESGGDFKQCPRCLSKNSKNAVVCRTCGFLFESSPQDQKERKFNLEQTQGEVALPLFFDPMGGIAPEEDFDGVKGRDLAKFIRINTPYYLNVFKQIKQKKSINFNVSAFFFSAAWFFYRKQYKIGILIAVAVAFLTFASSYLDLHFVQDITNTLWNTAGISNNQWLSIENYKSLMIAMDVLDWNQKILLFLPALFNILQILIMVFCGLMANKIYFKYAVSRILKIKAESNLHQEYEINLSKYGGTNFALGFILVLGAFLLDYLPYLF